MKITIKLQKLKNQCGLDIHMIQEKNTTNLGFQNAESGFNLLNPKGYAG